MMRIIVLASLRTTNPGATLELGVSGFSFERLKLPRVCRLECVFLLNYFGVKRFSTNFVFLLILQLVLVAYCIPSTLKLADNSLPI